MIKKKTYPSKFDAYGRQITREAYMDTPVDMYSNVASNGSNETANYPVQTAPVSPLDVKYNGCNCNNNSSGSGSGSSADNTYTDCSNHALYLKYSNVRIKYIGFIYNRVNYIVDLDNRKVLFKTLDYTKYQQLANRVTVTSDSLTCSYKLSFNMYKVCMVASVEIYPNDIQNCNVTITNKNTHESFLLDKDYIAYEFFDAKNMLDKNGNIITFINYQDIFKLTTADLMTLFSYPESINLIKSILDNVMNSKDLVSVVKDLLVDIKNKYIDWNSGICNDDNNNDITDDEFNDGCNCTPDCPVCGDDNDDGCICPPTDSDKPIRPCPPHTPPICPIIRESQLYGTYYGSDGEVITLSEGNKCTYSLCNPEDTLEWKYYAVGDVNREKIDDIIVEILDIDTETFYRFSYAFRMRKLLSINNHGVEYARDVKEFPSLDFAVITKEYITPSPIFVDGAISTENMDLVTLSDTNDLKHVSIQLDRKFITLKRELAFTFFKNNTELVDDNIYLTSGETDIDITNPEYIHVYKSLFKGLSYKCREYEIHKERGLYKIHLKNNVMMGINEKEINCIDVVIKCNYKETLEDTEYKTRYYQVTIDIID